jgi:hypothetical protein
LHVFFWFCDKFTTFYFLCNHIYCFPSIYFLVISSVPIINKLNGGKKFWHYDNISYLRIKIYGSFESSFFPFSYLFFHFKIEPLYHLISKLFPFKWASKYFIFPFLLSSFNYLHLLSVDQFSKVLDSYTFNYP